LIRVAVRCTPEHAERVLAELVELSPGGVEEERSEAYVEYAIYGTPGELPELPDLGAATGAGPVEVSSSEVPDDWADRWRDFHAPVVVGGRLRVRPSWHSSGGDGAIEVVIDPGRAFGTGAHATTRLCLELLLELADAGGANGSLADWGTGSGVLAIAAAKLGFSPLTACDHEPAALEAAEANAAANGVELELTRTNLRERPPPAARTVTANLTAPILLAVAPRLAVDPRRAPATLICSGLLASEVPELLAALRPCGLQLRERRAEGEWRALMLSRWAKGPTAPARTSGG
jgi:ribosomal protein L11 methyltransferase